MGKFQSVEGEESINIRLVDLLDKMRLVLQQASAAGANTLGKKPVSDWLFPLTKSDWIINKDWVTEANT